MSSHRGEIMSGEALEAGRELDGLIAERVFGRTHLVGEAVPEFWRHHGEPVESQEVWAMGGDGGWCRQCGNLPEFSTDIAAAWQVVEKLREKGWQVRMDSDLQTDTGPAWRVALDHNGPQHYVDEVDPSLPVAICRAALATLSPGEQG